MMNNHNYPKIHYPEVYVLEGGYCRYYSESRPRCVPPAYVRMDDPSHARSRKEDLDQFRKGKFGRTKSYAYGDAAAGGSSKMAQILASQAAKRERAAQAAAAAAGPVQGGGLAAPAAAGRSRSYRAPQAADARGLGSLREDAGGDVPTDDETDIGDSPCPPPTRTLAFKAKKLGRQPLLRAETCGRLGF
jgi:M-phase inducer tyrosine phosphatase